MLLFCRDVLPFTLKLPEVISAAKTTSDLEEVAKLGIGKQHLSLTFTSYFTTQESMSMPSYEALWPIQKGIVL